ncbi:MAG: Uma2 family endonuclease [Pyrinomonadaceae bacterium MAG19_C2-C3]|nr:Uma2 family endonuclease [Pyrinomonadaceae bacterium MAG19_C2-C3]
MITQTLNLYAVVENLPAGSLVVLPDISWDEYEELLEQIGETRSVRLSYCDGTLQIMVTSSEHENYAWFIGSLLNALRLRLRINMRFFGAPTMRKEKRRKGLEPDACFYVQSADLIGNRMHLDFGVDPPPDIAVEIDIHHGSISKFPIYAALGISEIWRYDGEQLRIHLLTGDEYVLTTASQALPMLTADHLTELLTRLREDGELNTILAFDEWLQTQQS